MATDRARSAAPAAASNGDQRHRHRQARVDGHASIISQSGVWRLEVSGLVARPQRLTLDELKALPRTEARLEHFCVEGWSAVAVRTGVRLSDLAPHVGLSADARYVDFQSFDDD